MEKVFEKGSVLFIVKWKWWKGLLKERFITKQTCTCNFSAESDVKVQTDFVNTCQSLQEFPWHRQTWAWCYSTILWKHSKGFFHRLLNCWNMEFACLPKQVYSETCQQTIIISLIYFLYQASKIRHLTFLLHMDNVQNTLFFFFFFCSSGGRTGNSLTAPSLQAKSSWANLKLLTDASIWVWMCLKVK